MPARRWFRPAILGALALGLAPTPAVAHAIRVDAAQLVTLSPFIAVGVVADSSVRWNAQHTLILTDYTFLVEQQLKGQLQQVVTLTIAGGELDDIRHATCLSSSLDVGARYVLFLEDWTAPSFSPLVGSDQGWVRQGPGMLGNQLDAEGNACPVLSIANGPVAFDVFVEQLTSFIQLVQANPPPLPPWLLPGSEDPTLPHADYDPTPAGAPDPDEPPAGAPPVPPPPPVTSPNPVPAQLPPGEKPPTNLAKSHWSGRPDLPMVMNQLPSWFTPWTPHDTWMMAQWNAFGGEIFRIRTAPTGTFGRDNGRNDICGFPGDALLTTVFGRPWKVAELAVAFQSFSRWTGKLIEADIALNPKYAWTIDESLAIDGAAAPWSFEAAMLHELGHAWSLAHPWETQNVWWDAVMNYAPKQNRRPFVFTDDAEGVRSAFGGVPRADGLLSLWDTADDPASNSATYTDNEFTSSAVSQGGSFTINHTFKVEVPGTSPLVAGVDVYLTPSWWDWTSAVYLETLSYPAPFAADSIYRGMNPGPIPVPASTPPGKHYLVMNLDAAGDVDGSNNADWTRKETRLSVNSQNWWLAPNSYWQGFAGAIAPTGTWVFQFNGLPGAKYDFSTCVIDGGSAVFSTRMQLLDPAGAPLLTATGSCGGSHARIVGWTPPASGTYTLKLSGVFPESSWGPFSLQYRRTSDDLVVSLRVDGLPQLDVVRLAWTGNQPTYDVERASRADFSDGQVIAAGVQSSAYDDATLSDGRTWFYRVR